MSGGILLVDTLRLHYPKATAEQIQKKYIQRVQKNKMNGIDVQDGFEYINDLVKANELKSQPAQLTIFQKLGNCRTSEEVINLYNELRAITTENPNLKIFYDAEFNKMIAQMTKDENDIPKKFIDYLLKNSQTSDELDNIEHFMQYGTKQQQNKFKNLMKTFKNNELITESSKKEVATEIVNESINNGKDVIKKSSGKFWWIVAGIAAAGAIINIIMNNKKAQKNSLNVAA